MSSRDTTWVERLVGHDQAITIFGLIALTLLSWVWMLAGAGTGMSTIAMTTWEFPPPAMDGAVLAWTPTYGFIMLTMWWVMMIAMMIPSAAPMILLYGRVARHARSKGQMSEHALPTSIFVLGYLAVWFAFSVMATAAQWGLEKVVLVHQMLMWSTDATLSGLLLIAAGAYQLTPWKTACLEHCRAPAAYLSANWQDGRWGAFRMGLTHGAYCLGCCWALMALLFAGGIMNLVWIAGLAIVVLIEKAIPLGHHFARALAMLMVGSGLWIVLQGIS